MNTLAVLLLSVVPTAEKSPRVDELNKVVSELKSAESKLKSSYTEVLNGYKKAEPIAKKIAEINSDTAVLKTQLLNVTGTSGRADQARANLRERIRGLERNKTKLEKEYKQAVDPVQDQENAFKEEEKKAWTVANRKLVPLLNYVKIQDDDKAHEAVLSVFDLFIFDDHKDLPNLKLASILEQPVLEAAAKCLATGGTKHIASIKKMFEKTTAMKYGATMAVKEIGPEAAKADKDIRTALNELKAALIKNKTLSKSERDARLVVVEKAIEAVK